MTRKRREYLRTAADDGLPAADVGRWAEEKYRRVGMYSEIVSTGMKGRWEKRVYVDLFAGPGHAVIRETKQRVLTSPLLALDVPNRFDKYVFVDSDDVALSALMRRANGIAPATTVVAIHGDANAVADRIAAEIPVHSRTNRVLTFCFIDPYSLNIHFETVRKLAEGRAMDVLILLALQMDANRNEAIYMRPDNPRIDNFLGDNSWRPRWKAPERRGLGFVRFLAEEYSTAMERLGYVRPGLEGMVEVKLPANNLPLYYLAFFSKDRLGYKYWDQVRKYSTDQLSLLGE